MAKKNNPNKPKSKYVSDKYKQGRISNDEIAFIKKNMNVMTEEQIADSINRRVEKVQEIKGQIIAQQQGFIRDDDSIEVIHDIKKRPEWPILKKQFSNDELAFLIYRYSQLVSQFNKDITPTEDIQIVQAIQLEIFMNRNAIATRQAQLKKEELEQLLQDIIQRAIDEKDANKKMELNAYKLDIQGKITAIVAGARETTKQFNDLHVRLDSQMKALKGTRDQRLDKIQKSGKTIFDLLKYLDDKEVQEVESRHHELVKLAIRKEELRLKDLHEYADGTYDHIMLTPDVVEKELEKDGMA